MQITIRSATHDDVDWLLTELKEFSDFYETKHHLFSDSDHTVTTLKWLIDTQLFFVAERAGKPLGFIAGLVTPHLFNPKIKVLSESLWWVAKEYRGTRTGLLLLEAFTAWGKENADWVTFSLERKSPVNERCLTRRGYQPQERAFLLET